MTSALLILVAHGLDAMTFLLAAQRWGVGGESNPLVAAIVTATGIGGLLLFKALGASLAAGIVAHATRWRTPMLLIAVAAGIVGALSNLAALAI